MAGEVKLTPRIRRTGSLNRLFFLPEVRCTTRVLVGNSTPLREPR